MNNNKKKYFCIIGVGKHTLQNLIPSLEKSGNKILALVSRTPKINNRRYKTIKTIDKAIKILPKKTIYIISTPPKTHYKIFCT